MGHHIVERVTRGRTAPNRLRRFDALLCRCEGRLLRRRDGRYRHAVFVDLGFGRMPWTTLESARAFRRHNPDLRVVGVEIDERRVDAARPFEDAATSFRRGTFTLPLGTDEPARLIRAMNVLRQYKERFVEAALVAMGRSLLDDGLLLEGTCERYGRVGVAGLYRRRGDVLLREALVFSTSFRDGFGPFMFRDRLPRDVRPLAIKGGPVHRFLSAWSEATEAERSRAPTQRALFERATTALAAREPGIDTSRWLATRGYLLWRGGPARVLSLGVGGS